MTATLIGIATIAAFAFSVEGAIGFGATVITTSLGAQLLPIDQLLPAFVPVNMVLSAYLLASGRRRVQWRVLLVEVAPPVAVGAAIGLALFHIPNKTALELALGVFVVALAARRLFSRPVPADRSVAPVRPGRNLAFLGLGGIAHGLFGTGGPMIVYVARRRIHDKSAFRASLAALWLSLNTALLINFVSLDLYDHDTMVRGGAIALVVLPGLAIGERIHRALDAAKFERAVWSLLLVAGTVLTVRSVWALVA